ncbi:hypothetical protein NMY22_g8897 [Coprinellus aureogranulatus]|nr:hypothetical protein NMY22_g8897 [Coprinellus aureogranulatus]
MSGTLTAILALHLALVLATPQAVVVDHLVSREYIVEERSLFRRGFGYANGGSNSDTGKDEFGELSNKKNFEISFYHVNDVHAHLDEFRESGSSCTDPTEGCAGGYPRIKAIVEAHRQTKNHSLFLNAGDEFQGTLFYTLYKGEAVSSILNQLGFDAMTLGNHEFDDGDDLLAAFISNLTFPVISANVYSVNKKLQQNIVPYKIFSTGKYKDMNLAVVAVTTEKTKTISHPDKGTTFEDPVTAVERTVAYIKSHHKEVNRFVALTHIGYENDIELAKQSADISLIIGGHSHTLLADNATAGAKGPYPTIVRNRNDEEVFVVTSYRWGEYLGYIDLEFDALGRVVRYEGAPIHLQSTNSTTRAEDHQLKAEVQDWAKGFEPFTKQIVGRTTLLLEQSTCQEGECTLGDLIGDALAGMSPSNVTSPFSEGGATAVEGEVFAGAIMNAGGIRSSIDAGNITLQHVLEVLPFGNALVELRFTSTELWDVFEGIVSRSNVTDPTIGDAGFAQVSSSIRLTYDPDKPVGTKLESLMVANGDSVSREGNKTYIVATVDYAAAGGDGFWPPFDPSEYITLDTVDEVLVKYLKALGSLQGTADGLPILGVELDGRIRTI